MDKEQTLVENDARKRSLGRFVFESLQRWNKHRKRFGNNKYSGNECVRGSKQGGKQKPPWLTYGVWESTQCVKLQKSATYTCQAQGTGASSELSVHVEVVNKTVVPLCPAEGKYGIAWQTTAPGMETVADCPFHAGGHAKRECRLTDYNTTEWDVPNFTGCLTSDVEAVYNNVILRLLFHPVFPAPPHLASPPASLFPFPLLPSPSSPFLFVFFFLFFFQFKRLTLGYEVTNGSSTLGSLLYIVSKRSTYLPGECERILDILDEVLKYLNSSLLFKDLENSSGTFYSIINLLMTHERCFITEKVCLLVNYLFFHRSFVPSFVRRLFVCFFSPKKGFFFF